VVALVRGRAMDIGCGFITFTGETPVWGFFIETSPINATNEDLIDILT
jgi:hypothetical protein